MKAPVVKGSLELILDGFEMGARECRNLGDDDQTQAELYFAKPRC